MFYPKRNELNVLFFTILISIFSRITCEPSASQSTVTIDNAVSTGDDLFTLQGKINIRQDEIDLQNIRILVDEGQYVGFIHSDGTFTITGLPSNSYVVEVSSPRNVYESVRVDINSKGKVRARRLNLLQPSEIVTLRYPLNFESKGYPNYFFKREQFRIMDILMSPMVLMMVVPLLLVLVLPKLVNQDPELKKELEQTQSMFQPNQNMPNLAELIHNFSSGSGSAKKPAKSSNKEGSSKKKA